MTLSRRILCAFFLFACFASTAPAQDDQFPTPDILKDNVAFWKKIYSEFTLQEGVLHDRDYPMIIYGKITIGDASGKTESRLVESAKAQATAALTNLTTKPAAEWGPEENRIKALFDQYAGPEALTGAVERLRFQRGQRDRYIAGLERSGMYIDTIRAILKKHNVPARLAYLPHVESSFNYNAYSSVGAAGLWQFMRSTGKLYLHIDYTIDERLDPVLATEAAAKLLEHNYNELQAWPLAITAYNHGLNGMKRAVTTTGSRDIAVVIEKYQSHIFQFASKNFYACFIAASEIAMNPVPYVGTVNYLPPAATNMVVLKEYYRPKDLADYLKISQDQIRSLNPSLRPIVFTQQRQIPAGFVLRIPAAGVAAAPAVLLAKIPDSLKSSSPDRSSYYRVVRGDNLVSIAARLGVTVDDLIAENNLKRTSRIFAGQVLQLPAKAAASAAVVASVATLAPGGAIIARPAVPETASVTLAWKTPEEAELEETPEIPEFSSAVIVTPPETPVLTARVPDSLKAVATATADTVPVVAGGTPAATTRFDAGTYNLETEISAPGLAEVHVSVDETPGHLADWLGIGLSRLRQINRLRPNAPIRIGQKLSIPIDREGALERFTQSRLEYHMALEEDFYGQYKVSDVKKHPIKRGETLWDLCNQDESVPLWLIRKYNKSVDLGKLKPGDTIWLPIIDEKTADDIAADAAQNGAVGYYPAYYEPQRNPSRLVRPMP